MESIPKIIHYCWFGGKDKPEEIKKYMKTWKEKFPDFRIVEWNENNFDIKNSIDYVREAYEAGKYAFVSDYVRLCALREYGGVYLDTDVEILQNFEALLNGCSFVSGFETETNLITAFIACVPSEPHITAFAEEYRYRHFKLGDNMYDQTPINDKFTEFMSKYGLKKNNKYQILDNSVFIYPYEVFCGYDVENSHLRITNETMTVHHFQSSWKKMDLFSWVKYKLIVKGLQKLIGNERYDLWKRKLKLFLGK